ncbi:hypothetical protein [Pseudoalteromonas sp.]|uniref:hypothetical protein n=1 Tax=Pseudoalteromonas sp. TaxID=53249 RepID=UPI00257E7CED|nr:hypothetical protein [Pseudoalteromonas sp.]
MARIQYNPQAKVRGFNPQQITTEGVSRMREESNRVIQNLQDNINIERQQRQAELKAMQNNAALVEKQFAENTRIALQNIKNQGMQRLANVQGEFKQAQLDAQATDSIVKSLLDFAPTLQEILNKQAEREVRNQTQQGLTADVQDISGEIEENRRAQEALLLGGVQLNENIKEDAILSGEPEVETLKRYRANHGQNGVQGQVIDNRVAQQAYETLMQRRMVDNQTVFTTSSGKQFKGVDALADGELYDALHRATLKEVSEYMGYVDPGYLATANTNIAKFHETRLAEVNQTQISRDKEALVIRAKEIGSLGTPTALVTAFTEIARIEGYEAAHNYLTDLIKNGTVAPEIIGDLVLPDGSGEKYSVRFGRSRFEPALKELNAATVKARTEQRKLDKARTEDYISNNFDDLYAFAREDPVRAEKEFFKLFKGNIPDQLKNILTMAKEENLDLKEDEIRKMALEGSLSETYINNLSNTNLIKLAKEELTQMRIRKYSADVDGNKVISATEDTYTPLIKGVNDYAKKLAEFSDQTPGATSSQVLMNEAAILNFIEEDLKDTNDAALTLQNLKGLIDTAGLQPGDPNYNADNPFSYTETSGRRVFRFIGNVDADKQNERAKVAQAIVELNPNRSAAKLGEILKQKDLLFTQKQYDEMRAAAEAGLPIPYTEGISFVGDTFGQSYIQILNTAAQLQGLDPIDVNVSPASALPNKYQRLLNSENYFRINRVKQTVTGNLSANMRPRMRQGSEFENMFLGIGVNEGTRTPDGGFNDAYYGHIDPGDGAQNRGTVSARAGTPEEADQTWRGILQQTQSQYDDVLIDLGVPAGSPEHQTLMFNILDLRVQAPAAVESFVSQIPQILEAGISAESIGLARHNSFINPTTGRLETTFTKETDSSSSALLRDQMDRAMTMFTGQRGGSL